MSTTDPSAGSGLLDDHCLVHQFIRLRGRRPSQEELATMESLARSLDVGTRTRRASMLAIRRELGKLILGRGDA